MKLRKLMYVIDDEIRRDGDGEVRLVVYTPDETRTYEGDDLDVRTNRPDQNKANVIFEVKES